jgi:hypothetical protein
MSAFKLTIAELRFIEGVCQAVKMAGTDARLKFKIFKAIESAIGKPPVPEEDATEEKKRAIIEEWGNTESEIHLSPVELQMIKGSFFGYKEFGSDKPTVNAINRIYEVLGF